MKNNVYLHFVSDTDKKFKRDLKMFYAKSSDVFKERL